MRRQMTHPPFLFWGNENLNPKRMGKNCSTLKKAFHTLPPCSHGRTFHALPAQHGAFLRGQWEHSSHEPSLAHWRAQSADKEGKSLSRSQNGNRGRPHWHPLADKASWLHPFDRPSFSAYHAKSKYPSVSWRTCSISDLIVLNIASSLQINGSIKSRSNGIPQSLWSS